MRFVQGVTLAAKLGASQQLQPAVAARVTHLVEQTVAEYRISVDEIRPLEPTSFLRPTPVARPKQERAHGYGILCRAGRCSNSLAKLV